MVAANFCSWHDSFVSCHVQTFVVIWPHTEIKFPHNFNYKWKIICLMDSGPYPACVCNIVIPNQPIHCFITLVSNKDLCLAFVYTMCLQSIANVLTHAIFICLHSLLLFVSMHVLHSLGYCGQCPQQHALMFTKSKALSEFCITELDLHVMTLNSQQRPFCITAHTVQMSHHSYDLVAQKT